MQPNTAMSSATLPSSRHFVTQLLSSLPLISQRTDDVTEEPNPLGAVSEPVKKQLLTLQILFPNEFVPALDLLDRRLVTRFHISSNNHQNAIGVVNQPGVIHHEALQTQPEDNAQINDAQMRDIDSDITTTPTIGPSVQITAEQAEDEEMVDVPAQQDNNPAKQTSHNQLSTIYYVRSAQQRSSRYNTSYDTSTSYEVRLTAWNCSCPAFAFSAFPAVHAEPAVATSHATTPPSTAQDQDVGWSFGGVSLGDGMPPVCKHLLACVLVEKCNGLFGAFVEDKDVCVEEAAGWAAGWGD